MVWLRRGKRRYLLYWAGLVIVISTLLVIGIAALRPRPSLVFEHTSVIWQSRERIDVVIDFRHDGTCVKGIWEQWVAGPEGDSFLIEPPRDMNPGDSNVYLEHSGGGRYYSDQITIERHLETGDYLFQGRFTCVDVQGGQHLFVTEWRPFHVPSKMRLDSEF